MAIHISRRSFLRYSALAGTTVLTAGTPGSMLARGLSTSRRTVPADLAVVSGSNYYDAAVRAVELMGGMERFVQRGARVGLLVNSRYTKPGTFVKPQITLAVIVMCRQAGAAQIVSLEDTSARYWRGTTLSREHRQFIDEIRSPRAHRTVLIPEGVNVRKADVVPDLLECDAYINMPIFKDHQGIRLTGALKNLMGAISDTSNQTFHRGSRPTETGMTTRSSPSPSPMQISYADPRSRSETRPRFSCREDRSDRGRYGISAPLSLRRIRFCSTPAARRSWAFARRMCSCCAALRIMALARRTSRRSRLSGSHCEADRQICRVPRGGVDRAHGSHRFGITGTACRAPHRGRRVDPR